MDCNHPDARPRPRAIVATAACTAVAALGLASAAHAADNPWSRTVDRQLSAAQLGVEAGASPRTLARAAIDRSAPRLGLERSPRGLRFAGEQATSRDLRVLRFQQTVGGLRVLWSAIDVAVSGDRVTSIGATTMPLSRHRLPGSRRIDRATATRIARRAAPGSSGAAPAQLVAYAGAPAKPRSPRRAWIVQVQPPQPGAESPSPLCVVVDAATGKVLGRWRGTLAVDGGRAADARGSAAQAGTVVYQLTNDAKDDTQTGYAYGVVREVGRTTGSPFLPATFQVQTFLPSSVPLNHLGGWIREIHNFVCGTHKYCGRRGGFNGSFNRYFVAGNFKGDQQGVTSTSYDPNDEHIRIQTMDSNDPGVIAHEVGHLMDHHYRDDHIDSFRTAEVDEALAMMFAYDFERDRTLPGSPTHSNWLANPSAIANPADGNRPYGKLMKDYDCTAQDPHTNSTILGHAYWQFVKHLGTNGYEKAGRVLQYIPWALPASRNFTQFRFWLTTRARELLGPTGEKAAIDALNVVGVKNPVCGTEPPPNPSPVCKTKPSECDDLTGVSAAAHLPPVGSVRTG